VNCLASHLREDGLQKSDRVAFLCPNTPALLEAHFAVPAAGGILVAVNTRLNSQEIDYILNHSGVKFLFVDAELAPLVEPLHLESIQVVRIDDSGSAEDAYEAFLTAGSPEPVTNWLEDEEEAIAINDTSGTTGNPKGVMYTYRGCAGYI
jgi:fatty-acyl-CoA synthase